MLYQKTWAQNLRQVSVLCMGFFPFFFSTVIETSEYSETSFFYFDLKVNINSKHFNRYRNRNVAFFLNLDFKICTEINVIWTRYPSFVCSWTQLSLTPLITIYYYILLYNYYTITKEEPAYKMPSRLTCRRARKHMLWWL